MSKVYAVRAGRKPGVYTDWNTCQEQIKGYRGAEFKSFKNPDDAKAYLEGKEVSTTPQSYIPSDNDTVTIITKGTTDIETGMPVGTIRMVQADGKMRQVSFKVSSHIEATYIAELCAVLMALSTAEKMGKTRADIYYTFDGVEKWAVGEWTPKSKEVLEYVKCFANINIEKKLSHYTGSKINVNPLEEKITYEDWGIFNKVKTEVSS